MLAAAFLFALLIPVWHSQESGSCLAAFCGRRCKVAAQQVLATKGLMQL